MSDFRTAVEPDKAADTPAPAEAPADTSASSVVKLPDLLATFQDESGKPYAAEYFDVKDMWNKEAGLKYELETIEGYLKKQVSEGKLANNTKAAADFMKSMEKEAKIQRFDSAVQRITKLVAFIEFKEYVHG